MIYNMEEFERCINSVLGEIPFLYTEQLKMYLVNTYQGVTYELAESILFGLQRKGDLLLSTDGWAMTKGVYHRIVDDKFDDKLLSNEKFRLPDMSLKIRNANFANYSDMLDAIDCLWIVIDLLPNSHGFFVARKPWSIIFDYVDSDGNSKLYEIAKVNSINENIRKEMFLNIDPVSDEKLQDDITRIAVLENENHAWKIPRVGFRFICTIDPNTRRMYRIVERREGEDVWADERKEETA